jgi:uncharacterized membrane protein
MPSLDESASGQEGARSPRRGANAPTDIPIDDVDPVGKSVAQLYARAEAMVDLHQRRVEGLTRLLGRPAFLYVVLVAAAIWILANAVAFGRGFQVPDPPPFVWLQGLLSLLAFVVATSVLIRQNRQGRGAEQRSLLDLHVNLLVEQKVAKLIALVEELRRDIPSVNDRPDAEARAMTNTVDPHEVIHRLEKAMDDPES